MHEVLLFLQLRRMARFGKLVPFHFSNLPKERFDNFILRFVVAPVDQQCRRLDLVNLVSDIEGLERACDVEF